MQTKINKLKKQVLLLAMQYGDRVSVGKLKDTNKLYRRSGGASLLDAAWSLVDDGVMEAETTEVLPGKFFTVFCIKPVRKPLPYDAVLGGNTLQPRPWDAVLGNKRN